jgi:hypothetical protein
MNSDPKVVPSIDPCFLEYFRLIHRLVCAFVINDVIKDYVQTYLMVAFFVPHLGVLVEILCYYIGRVLEYLAVREFNFEVGNMSLEGVSLLLTYYVTNERLDLDIRAVRNGIQQLLATHRGSVR